MFAPLCLCHDCIVLAAERFSESAARAAAKSCDSTTTQQSSGGEEAKCAMQDVKRAVFTQTCLFSDETGGKLKTSEC